MGQLAQPALGARACVVASFVTDSEVVKKQLLTLRGTKNLCEPAIFLRAEA